jgi:cytochrome c553
MKALFRALVFSFMAIGAAGAVLAQSAAPTAAPAPLQYAKQGWTDDDRQTFYTTSQGSHMMPYAWFKALRRLDVDEPFAGDQLQRYGYLPNDRSRLNPEGLPVGFVIDGDVESGELGMTCAACHTAQIEYQKDGRTQLLRIDGAPATANFQAFLADLTAATRATESDADRFSKFAHAALGKRYSTTRAEALKSDFADWVKQWGDFMDKSLPASPWGPGRLDDFGMIFNRVSGKDLKIDANFKVADAPVSYPFLWNASRQDRTQWNGGVPNGLFINALGRNTGEVLGVFADFAPKKLPLVSLVNYGSNSVKFTGLQTLEEKITTLKPPPWPFALNQDLVDRGRVIYARECGSCHEEKRLPEGTWLTPVVPVGTDTRMFENSQRVSTSAGLLTGAWSPNPPGSKLPDKPAANDILATAVVGVLINEAFPFPPKLPNANSGVWQAIKLDIADLLPDSPKAPSPLILLQPTARANLRSHIEDRLGNMFKVPGKPYAYEARVLHGIWATAPYLHNGSVPNLWELLTPPAQRKSSFMVGSREFDPKNVGYVTDKSPFKDGAFTVNTDINSGNSNAGHDFGTTLSDDDKWALIEYLKQL